MKETLTAETITIPGHNGDEIEAYLAKPGDTETFARRRRDPSPARLRHLDQGDREEVRGERVRGPDAEPVHREAPGASPDDAAATARAKGGVPDEQVVGDVGGAADYLRALPGSNGKIGVIGYCSGGRQSFLVACSIQVQAAVDCYGGAVVHVPEQAPASMKPLIGLSENLSCPLLGLFGADDQFPVPADMTELSGVLDSFDKPHEFHTFEGAGHAFFSVDRPSYRVDAATQGWAKIWEFFGQHLA